MKVKNLYIGDIYAIVEKKEVLKMPLGIQYKVTSERVRTTLLEKIDDSQALDILDDKICEMYKPREYINGEEFAINLDQSKIQEILSGYHKEDISKRKLTKLVKKKVMNK